MVPTRVALVSIILFALTSVAVAQAPRPAGGASCHDGASFERFLADLKKQAIAAGVSQRTINAASPYMVYDQGIVNRDRGQRVFGQLFSEFAARMAAPYRMQQGQARIRTYAKAFARAEKEYGVPGPVIAAFWGLESDFGSNMGNLPILKSLVSLAYDCRRSDMFVNETIAALKVIDRGDLTPDEMIGSWAGELGQTQFLPAHYVNYAVDYDGDGRRDLLHSAPDVIGSTANYLATGLKWRRGEPWLEEIVVPKNFPWDQADLTVSKPLSEWIALGVTYPNGRALPNKDLTASVLLPMGRMGPAFLAYPNFAAYTQWNNSLIYSTTAGYLAARIGGAAPMRKTGPIPQLPFQELKELQQLLTNAGYDVGKIDGVLGQQSRTAVKAMQIKYGLPADSWPTAELLNRMRGGGARTPPSAGRTPSGAPRRPATRPSPGATRPPPGGIY